MTIWSTRIIVILIIYSVEKHFLMLSLGVLSLRCFSLFEKLYLLMCLLFLTRNLFSIDYEFTLRWNLWRRHTIRIIKQLDLMITFHRWLSWGWVYRSLKTLCIFYWLHSLGLVILGGLKWKLIHNYHFLLRA